MPLPPDSSREWHKRTALEIALGMEAGHESDYPAFRNVVRAFVLKTALRMLGIWERGRENTRKPVLREITVQCPALPTALEGLQILHLSDFHYPENDPQFDEAVVEILKGQSADLCLLTGDYRYGYFGPAAHVAPKLAQALAGVTTKHGAFAVFGNHDTSTMLSQLEAHGITLLFNSGANLKINGQNIWIAGTDDPHRFQCDNLGTAMRGAPEDAFKIALVHSPELYRVAATHGVHLYLCGHTHAGQIRLPKIGAPVRNASCPRHMTWGAWQYRAMQGHTSAGLGVTDVPIRFNCPPEATLITLASQVPQG